MKNTNKLKGQKVLVFGLGKSGISCCRLCQRLGAEVLACDSNVHKKLKEKEEWQALDIQLLDEKETTAVLDENFDFMIKSPGIPYQHPLIQQAQALQLDIITDIELAYLLSPAPIIAITGTNGKTTVTTLIAEMINQSQLKAKAYASGNIGIAVSDVVQEISQQDYFVMELSSFQLMGVKNFRPHIALITNLYSAHLDYHTNRQEYVQAKFNIFAKQEEDDFFIYNGRQQELIQAAQKVKSKPLAFSNSHSPACQTQVEKGWIYYKNQAIIQVDDILLAGEHNLENICAAISVCKLVGVDNQAIQHVLKTFSGVKHRLQLVKELEGRLFYNDSKATNVLASEQALKSFEKNIIWLAGGLDRQEDLTPLKTYLQERVKALIVSGENRSDFKKLADGVEDLELIEVENMAEAVCSAYQLSQSGDIILLSPASASWDRYPSFEARGDEFIQAVNKLK